MSRIHRDLGLAAGIVLVGLVAAIAFLGPFVAPHSPTAPIGPPAVTGGYVAPLGTDMLGRDVLSRVLYGGRLLLLVGVAATVVAYAIGGVIGLAAGVGRGRADTVITAGVDLLLAFPGFLLLLLVIAALGTGMRAVFVGVVVAQIPAIARYVRTIALEVGTTTYVEAAKLRGERTLSMLRVEVVPNVSTPLIADLTMRFVITIFMVAAVNFLGAGPAPPASDWARMINDNRSAFALNPLAVLAPVALIAVLSIGANLVGESLMRKAGRSHD